MPACVHKTSGSRGVLLCLLGAEEKNGPSVFSFNIRLDKHAFQKDWAAISPSHGLKERGAVPFETNTFFYFTFDLPARTATVFLPRSSHKSVFITIARDSGSLSPFTGFGLCFPLLLL